MPLPNDIGFDSPCDIEKSYIVGVLRTGTSGRFGTFKQRGGGHLPQSMITQDQNLYVNSSRNQIFQSQLREDSVLFADAGHCRLRSSVPSGASRAKSKSYLSIEGAGSPKSVIRENYQEK